MQFVALKPQAQWDNSPLSTTDKFAGRAGTSKDLTITPTNGIIQVVKMSDNVISIDNNSMQIVPNPVKDVVTIVFNVLEPTNASLTIRDLQGRLLMDIVSGQIPQGQFSYQANLGKLATGLYIATLSMENGVFIAEKLVKQD